MSTELISYDSDYIYDTEGRRIAQWYKEYGNWIIRKKYEGISYEINNYNVPVPYSSLDNYLNQNHPTYSKLSKKEKLLISKVKSYSMSRYNHNNWCYQIEAITNDGELYFATGNNRNNVIANLLNKLK